MLNFSWRIFLNKFLLRIFFLALTSAIYLGCAKPTYINSNDTGKKNTEQKQGATTYDCSLKWNSKNYCLSWSWKKKPTEEDYGSMILRVYQLSALDNFAEPVDLNSIPQVILWMPSMNHGSSPTTVKRISIGTFQVDDVFFTMPGKWEIRFRLLDGDSVDEVIDPISI